MHCRRGVVLRTTLLNRLGVPRIQIRPGMAKVGTVAVTATKVQIKGLTRTHADSGYRQGVRPVVVILPQEVAVVALAAVVGVAVTAAPRTPPTQEPQVCHPPGVLYNQSFKCCRP